MCTCNVFCTALTTEEGEKKREEKVVKKKEKVAKKEEKVVKIKGMCRCVFNLTFMCVHPQSQPRVVAAHTLELVLRTSKQSLKWIATSVFYYELFSC